MSAVLLTDDDMESRIAALNGQLTADPDPSNAYRFIRPLAAAADDYIELVQNEEGRWLFGIQELDFKIRGLRDSELMYITGRVHSGKTQILLQSIVNNPTRPCILFTYDEVDTLVLSKLIAMTRKIDAEALETAIKARDADIMALVKRVATDTYSKLLIVDRSLNIRQMTDAIKEAEDYWGEKCAMTAIDYLDQIPGGAGDLDGTKAKADQVKRWTKAIDRPVICLAQSSRSSGPRGKAAGLEAMRYGGDDGATFVLEVFRRRDDMSLDSWQRQSEDKTVTVNVDKNKRPPSHKGEVDLFLHPKFGYVRPLQDGDKFVQGQALSGPSAALSAQRAQQ